MPLWLEIVLVLLAAPALFALGVGVGAFLTYRLLRGQPPIPWPAPAHVRARAKADQDRPERERPTVPRVGA